MNELIAIRNDVVGLRVTQTVNARDLHAFLDVGTRFNDWIASRIEQYGFVAGQDYAVFTENPVKGRPSVDYSITIDMAKELSMVERNEKGKQARQYFLECERYAKENAAPRELTRMELLQIAMDSEQKRIDAEAERDHAIATKAQIGNKREATAMATASAAMKQVRRLEGELGRNQKHATVIAVGRAIGKEFPRGTYVNQRRWCRANNHTPVEVADDRYGTVKAWPAAAWMAAFGIDLGELFATSEGNA